MKRSESALGILNNAIKQDSKNPLCKFHRASILFGVERHEEALKELEELTQIVPKESLVYFLIGKVRPGGFVFVWVRTRLKNVGQ